MATEDVTIRIRVDDSELRRELSDLRRRGAGVPAQGLVAPGTAALLTGGLAGSIASSATQATGRNLARARAMDALISEVAPGLADGSTSGILGSSGKAAARDGAGMTAEEISFRESEFYRRQGLFYDFGDPTRGIPGNERAQHFSEAYRADSPVWRPELETLDRQIDVDREIYALESSGQIRRPAPIAGRDARNIRLVHQMWGSGNVLSTYPPNIFTAPLTRSERNLTAPLTKRPLWERVSRVPKVSIGDIGSRLKPYAGKARELFDRVGGIASVGALLAVSKEVSARRSEYVKRLLAGEEVPDGGLVQGYIGSIADKSFELLGDITFTSMFEMPSTLLSFGNAALSSRAGAFIMGTALTGNPIGGAALAYLGPDIALEQNELELALDMVGKQFKEDLGLTEGSYKEVRAAQNKWTAAANRLDEQVKRSARQQANNLGAMLQGLGVSGVSLNELSNTIYDETNFKMRAKARNDFEKDNPFPTSRLVNPYGNDESVGLYDLISPATIISKFAREFGG